MDVLKCFYCWKREKTVNALIKHVKKEMILPYKCNVERCRQKTFGNIESFRSHIKKHVDHIDAIQENMSVGSDDVMDNNEVIEIQMDLVLPYQPNIRRQISNLRLEFLKVHTKK